MNKRDEFRNEGRDLKGLTHHSVEGSSAITHSIIIIEFEIKTTLRRFGRAVFIKKSPKLGILANRTVAIFGGYEVGRTA